jgi:hypothetical protein
VTILVLHDFDKSGISILDTLRHSARRYTYRRRPSVIDLGLRLPVVQEMGLESEPVEYRSRVDPRINLRRSGASSDECDFLVQRGGWGWSGKRVELNAMNSTQFVDFVNREA